jgi:tetratricopeptide (TPR) repeat protein
MKKEQLKKGSSKKDNNKQYQQQSQQIRKKGYTNLVGLGIIIVLGIIIYSNSFNCSFHFDDLTRIVDNPNIRNLSDVKAWWNDYPTRPVGMFTLALNYHFNQLNVQYYHLVNLIIHLINACLAGWLTLLIFSSPALKDNPVTRHKNIIAFFTALMFVSHPLATQSVTYIIQRLASMAAMFYLLSLALYMKARLTNKIHTSAYLLFAGSLISGVLAVLTKENAFTLPFAILLFEICFLRTKKISINFKNYRVITIMAVFLTAILIILLKFSSGIFKPIPPSQYNPYTLTPLNYLFTQFNVIIKYIQLLFLPINQNLDYDFPISNNFFRIRTLLSFLVLFSLFTLAIFLFKKYRIISFGIFWFFLTLSIESGFIPINDVIFEHRTYLPSFGFFLILSWGVYALFWNKYKYLAISIFVIIIGSNSFLTFERNKVWKDNLTLWNDVISKSPDKARPFINRGFAYTSLGQMDKAIDDYTRAIEINPEFTDSYYNRGLAYGTIGQFDKAIADYSKAMEIDPAYTKAYSGCGVAYYNLGQWDKAIAEYSRAIEIDPKYADAFYNRGIVYGNLGQLDKAIADYSKVIEINPGYTIAYSNRGNAYSNLRQMDKAIADYTKAIIIDPNYRDGYYNRGITYYNLGQFDKAIADFSNAIEIDPGYSTAYSNRGVAYASQGHWKEAIEDYSKAIGINPDYADAYINRGIAYSNLGQWNEAIDDYTKAIGIEPNYTNIYLNRGTAYSHLNRWNEAIADFSRAIEIDPANATAHTDYNLAYQKLHSK